MSERVKRAVWGGTTWSISIKEDMTGFYWKAVPDSLSEKIDYGPSRKNRGEACRFADRVWFGVRQ